MACLIVPGSEALIVTALSIALEMNAKAKSESAKLKMATADFANAQLPLHKRLRSLSAMLWIVTALLAVEHIYNGEIVFHYPFLTAAGNPEAMSLVYNEMATEGVAYALFTTLLWAGYWALKKYRTAQHNSLTTDNREPAHGS